MPGRPGFVLELRALIGLCVLRGPPQGGFRMAPIVFFSFLLALPAPDSPAPDLPWHELAIHISASRESRATSRRSAACGSKTTDAHLVGPPAVFEAEALEGGQVVERARGRFGLTLGARETLETSSVSMGDFGISAFVSSPRSHSRRRRRNTAPARKVRTGANGAAVEGVKRPSSRRGEFAAG